MLWNLLSIVGGRRLFSIVFFFPFPPLSTHLVTTALDNVFLVQGIRVEVEVGPAAEEWLMGEGVAGLCSCLALGPTRNLLTESMVHEDQAVEKRCAKAFAAVKVPPRS